ncbi:MAG TPA: DUF177 domain-containing protein [Ktedonobacteraceae bacterium]|nr:DUF177 domain-containing protein [Ktedonobacteraceae bacterium]
MIYNVAQLMKSTVGNSITEKIDEDQIQLDDTLHVIGPITGQVRMRRVNQGLLVDGWVDLVLELTCARCLKTFEQPMHVPFEERFYPTVDVVTGAPLPLIEEDDVFPIDEHHQVDLTEAIRQNVLLALPMMTLCSEDCAGLCPQCGHDLNLGPCNCEPEVVDSRLNALKSLLNGTQP